MKTRLLKSCAACVFLWLTLDFAVASSQPSAITFYHAWIPLPKPGTQVAKGYVTLTNGSDLADRLVAVQSSQALKTGLQISDSDNTDLLSVTLPIGPRQKIQLAPGKGHVLFLFPYADFSRSGYVSATLVFERAGALEVHFEVESAARGQAHKP